MTNHPSLKNLWNEAYTTGYDVRHNKKDGQKSWQPLKEKYSKIITPKKLTVKENIINMAKAYYKIDINDKDHLNSAFKLKNENSGEKYHFFVQHFRIPTIENFALSVVKLCQIAYNAGQFAASADNGEYDDVLVNFYRKNKLGEMSTFVDDYDVVVQYQSGGYDTSFSKYISENSFVTKIQNTLEIDKNSKYKINDIRAYRDETTKQFTNIFLSDLGMRLLFIDYIFNAINSGIQCDINDELVTHSMVPLIDDEDIYFIYKGGNVLNHYFNKLKSKFIEKFKNINKNNQTYITEYEKNFNNNFMISDVDFSVYINTTNNRRFVVIRELCYRILAKKMEEITYHFNKLYDSVINGTNTQIMNDDNDSTDISQYQTKDEEYKTYDKILKNLKHNFKSKNVTTAINEFITLSSKNNIPTTKIFTLIKIYQITNYIQQLNLQQAVPNYATISNTCKTNIEKLVNKKLSNLMNANFYTKSKIDNLKDKLATYFTNPNIPKVKYSASYTLNGDIKVSEYTLVNNTQITKQNIGIESKNDTITYSGSKFNKQMLSTEIQKNNNYHYISFNNTINQKNNFSEVNFDLMRIKFNVVLVGGFIMKNNNARNLRIPSEFLDVSINYFNKNDKFISMVNKSENKIIPSIENVYNNKTYITHSYNIDILIDDLNGVLFHQLYFMPWLDNKYEKRLQRLLFLISYKYSVQNKMNSYKTVLGLLKTMSDEINEDSHDETTKFINKTLKNIFIFNNESDLEYIKNLIINGNIEVINTIDIKEDYKSFKDIIITSIVWYFIFKGPSDVNKLLNKVHKFNGVKYINDINGAKRNVHNFISACAKNCEVFVIMEALYSTPVTGGGNKLMHL